MQEEAKQRLAAGMMFCVRNWVVALHVEVEHMSQIAAVSFAEEVEGTQ